jgi:hypothetical protein
VNNHQFHKVREKKQGSLFKAPLPQAKAQIEPFADPFPFTPHVFKQR